MKIVPVLLLALCGAAGAFPVSGTVRGTDGKPVAGAAVTLYVYKPVPISERGKDGSIPPLPLKHATTDALGRFAFPDTPGADKYGSVSVTADKFAPASAGFDRLPDTEDSDFGRFGGFQDDDIDPNAPRTATVTLTPETLLPVRVVDTAGHGVAGLQIYPRLQTDYSFPWSLSAEQRAYFARQCPPTDAEGRTTATLLPQGGQVRLTVRDDRWANLPGENGKYYPLGNAPVSAAQIVTVQPAASLSGRVRTKEGRAIAHVRISVGADDGREGDSGRDGILTDRRGAFTVRGLEAGTYRVNVSVGPDKDYVSTRTQMVTLAAGEHKTFDTVAQAGSLLTGRVLDDRTGKPVAGASVDQSFGDIVGVGVTQTGKDGRFRLRVQPGRHNYGLSAPPHFQFPRGQYPAYTMPKTFVNDVNYDIGDVRFSLVPLPPPVQASIRGKVVDTAGRPVARATVFYARTGFGGFMGGGFGGNSAGGGAVGFRFGFQAPVFGLLRQFQSQPTITAPGSPGLLTEVEKPAPPFPSGGGFSYGRPSGIFGPISSARTLLPPPSVETDSSGSFVLANVVRGYVYVLSARKNAWGTTVETQVRLTGKDGATADPAAPVLRLSWQPMATVRGQVVNKDGSPAVHVPVDISPLQGLRGTRKLPHTDAKGFFQCAVPPVGTYFFYSAGRDDTDVVSLPVRPRPDQWLLLPPMTLAEHLLDTSMGYMMTLRVVGKDGLPVPNAQLFVTRPQTSPPYMEEEHTETGDDGRAPFGVLPPGQYAVRVTGADGAAFAPVVLTVETVREEQTITVVPR